MKTKLLKSIVLILAIGAGSTALAQNSLTFQISNPQDAQALYSIMTGVQEEGAAGHTYRKGRSILCWHVNADMNDAQGKAIPSDDPRRYGCSMDINDRGLASPGKQF